MARLSIWLAGVFLFGMLILGVVQTALDEGSVPTGLAIAEAAPDVSDQRELNLCRNSCMDACVTKIDDTTPCKALCREECGG